MTLTHRTFLLLAVAVCITVAQRPVNQRCLCRRVRDNYLGLTRSVQDIQIYPPTPSCDRLEIIVSFHNGMQYCLNPKRKIVQNLLIQLTNKPTPPNVPSQTEAA
ncbi:hypothetical protein UPYG_G00214300 [Umbra pygmaea]|uniref:Chemokine interleukin-8-like domain-containing protein n=1 Tax=Umbra pygmaea TaxID=75934 RepID=A0ABD0X6N9_UMBPY